MTDKIIDVDELADRLAGFVYGGDDSYYFLEDTTLEEVCDVIDAYLRCYNFEAKLKEPRKAKWFRKHEFNELANDNFYCSNCNIPGRYPYKFCGHCGSIMEDSIHET